MSKNALMQEIMEHAFAENEWRLFLDTHPNDKKSVKIHYEISKKLDELTRKYESQDGPIHATHHPKDGNWKWINDMPF